MVSSSCSGDVSITDRFCPLLRPFVVSSSTGIDPALHPNRPPVSVSTVRWTWFIDFRTRSLGIRSP